MLRFNLEAACELYVSLEDEVRYFAQRQPYVSIFLTQRVSHSFHRLSLTNGVRKGDTWHCRLHGVLEFPLAEGGMAALGNARLCLHAFAPLMNKHNEVCPNQAGCLRVALGQVVAGLGTEGGQTLTGLFLYPMMLGKPQAVKGRVTFALDRCCMTYNGTDVRKIGGIKWKIVSLPLSPLEDYIETEEQQFGPQGMKSTWRFFENVNLFRYVSSVGVLPAAAYIGMMPARPRASYYANAARLALRMQQTSEETALAWDVDNNDDARHGAYWLASMLSLYVQACDYIPDEVCTRTDTGFRIVPVEWFAQARIRDGAIDCEDAALETMVEGEELELLHTDDPLLLKLQRIKMSFYTSLLLDGVSSAEINLSHNASPSHLDAHMNSALVNKGQLRRWARHPTLCREHGPTDDEVRQARVSPPIVMMEGTGPLDPNGIEHSQLDEVGEAILEQMMMRQDGNLMEQVRRVFHYDSSGKRQSGFYKAVKILSTAELARRGCGEYLFMLAPEPSRVQVPTKGETTLWNGVTAGVSFQDMAAASDHIIALAEKPLTDEQRKICDEYMADLHPQPELEGPGDRPDGKCVLRARAQMAKLKVTLVRASSGRTRGANVAVRQVKFGHFDEQGVFLQKLIDFVVKSHGPRLAHFEAEEYQVTPDRGFWQMKYYFEPRFG